MNCEYTYIYISNSLYLPISYLGHIKVVEHLISKGAIIHIKFENEYTPLCGAAGKGITFSRESILDIWRYHPLLFCIVYLLLVSYFLVGRSFGDCPVVTGEERGYY